MRHPVTCTPQTPLREAVTLMHEQQVGSIVVVDEHKAPLGIFTLRDLRQTVANGSSDFNEAIEGHMTRAPFFLSPDHSAFDAAIAMTERHIAHVCLVKDQRLCGVVSERDLFSLQRVDLVHLARTIRNAQKVENLVALRGEIGQLVERMLAHGASSTQITHIITLLNDHTVCRVIELTLAEKGDPGVPFSWLCFGSEGRREQTLHTDQDNGILFEASDAAQAAEIRGKLLPIAQQINQSLALCGFTLCKGNIMASNPELCLSRAEWARRFAAFIREATPENLLGSSIYFDLRVVWGSEQGCEQLRRGILDQVGDNRLFQRMMAENALRNRPPVGRFRDFVLARKNGEKATLDLKTQGLAPFVDGARLLALVHGIEANNTLERFRQLVDKEVIDPWTAPRTKRPITSSSKPACSNTNYRPGRIFLTRIGSIPTASIIWTDASCVSPCARHNACKAAWPCGISYEPVFVAAPAEPHPARPPAISAGAITDGGRPD